MNNITPADIRGHARGGQGMVTAFEILAKIFSYHYNFEVQSFPFFGVERTGAPIQAYLRISPDPILNRSYIYHPNLVIIFDESLIRQTPVFDGLTDNGIILINSERPPIYYRDKAKNIFTVPATRISVDKKLGSKSLPIVNAAMVGAMLKILDADIGKAKEIIGNEVPSKPEANAEVAETAFHEVKGFSNNQWVPSRNGSAVSQVPEPISPVPFWDKPLSFNKTGSWRVIAPRYENRQPPCAENCPAGTEVRKFVQLASEKKIEEAYHTIYEHNPFPSICGRVCPHFCQQNCNRIHFDQEVNIGAIERFVGDQNASYAYSPAPITRKEQIAVAGSGPAGLTAALRLRNMGYSVTVFEALPKAGGMMRSGIPGFRLPEDVLDKEIQKIEQQGVKIVTNRKVTIGELEKDYSAIITAVGSHIGTNLNLENEDELIDGIAFLRKLKLEQDPNPDNAQNLTHGDDTIHPGDKTAIIGGGNTAIDVARSVLRFGGIPTIYYRRTQKEMPAIAGEVEDAMKEGVQIEFLSAPVSLKKNKNGNRDMVIQKMEMGEPDESGRRRPVPIEGSRETVRIDKIIKAIGQRSDDFVFSGKKVDAKQGRLPVDVTNGKIPVFCAGDMAWGGTVVEAIGSGNEIAKEVDAFLGNKTWVKAQKSSDVVSADEINFAYYLPAAGHSEPVDIPENLVRNFAEVKQGLSENQVVAEAGRCLRCGECFNCGNCLNYCPDAAISIDDENRLRIDYDYCKGCGVCVRECPCSSILYEEQKIID